METQSACSAVVSVMSAAPVAMAQPPEIAMIATGTISTAELMVTAFSYSISGTIPVPSVAIEIASVDKNNCYAVLADY